MKKFPIQRLNNLNKYLKHTKQLENGCMIWQRAINSDGYARALIKGNYNGKVHREVFAIFYGYYPPVVRHKCDTPLCINPWHLQGGTAKDNMKDQDKRGRRNNHVSNKDKFDVLSLRRGRHTYGSIANILDIKIKRVEYICTRYTKG